MNITPPATTQTTNIPAPIKAPTASFAVVGSVEENLLISKKVHKSLCYFERNME